MKDSKPKTQMIRLGKTQADQLSKLGDRFGASQAQMVRWAVEALIQKVERSGGKIVLPFVLDSDESTEAESKVKRKPAKGGKV